MAGNTGSTIIIKKIKKGGHGHHGGAWKVAYADFVTAMMSFFLLLWLLTATPVENLKGLADYFSPTLGLQGKLGIGFAGGRSPDSEGQSQGNWASMGLIFGAPPSGPIIKFPDKDNSTNEDNQKVEFGKIKDDITQKLGTDEKPGAFEDSVLIEQTPDGLKINIMDTENRPMFQEGSAELEPAAKKILAKIAGLVKDIPNYLQITGNTSAKTTTQKEDYSNWELSAERANAARRYLLKAGVANYQIARVLAIADQEPIDSEHPDAPQNNRVTITLLRKTMLAYNRQPAPEEVIMGPVEAGLKTYLQDKKSEDSEVVDDETANMSKDELEAAKTASEAELAKIKHFSDDDIEDGSKKHKKTKKKDKKKSDAPKKKKKKAASSEPH